MRQEDHDMRPDEVAKFVTNPDPIILEIGCNDGTDTNLLLGQFPQGQIHCFEPDPRAIDRFSRTVHSNRVYLNQVAVSDRDRTTTFYGSAGQPESRANHYCRLPEWDLSGSLCKPTGHLKMSPWVTFPENRQYQVRTQRLDSWLIARPWIKEIDFIWTDVQGAEALLIQGAAEALKRTRYFYTEYYDTPMYEGQPNLKQLQAMLPGFELVAKYHTDNALFKHRSV